MDQELHDAVARRQLQKARWLSAAEAFSPRQ
jgi:hypothetical protein